MRKLLFMLTLFLVPALGLTAFAAKVPAPEQGGEGFQSVTLEEVNALKVKGATLVACHSHTTDFMDGQPEGTIHITCLVPKDHKRIDLPLEQVDFDINQLPKDKNATIVTYCASST